MSIATKVTFGLAAFLVVLTILVGSFLLVRTDALESEAAGAPSRELRSNAAHEMWEYRSYFRKLWLVPVLGIVFAFFGWVEYFKQAPSERTKLGLLGGIVTTICCVVLLSFFGFAFVSSLGGHG